MKRLILIILLLVFLVGCMGNLKLSNSDVFMIYDQEGQVSIINFERGKKYDYEMDHKGDFINNKHNSIKLDHGRMLYLANNDVLDFNFFNNEHKIFDHYLDKYSCLTDKEYLKDAIIGNNIENFSLILSNNNLIYNDQCISYPEDTNILGLKNTQNYPIILTYDLMDDGSLNATIDNLETKQKDNLIIPGNYEIFDGVIQNNRLVLLGQLKNDSSNQYDIISIDLETSAVNILIMGEAKLLDPSSNQVIHLVDSRIFLFQANRVVEYIPQNNNLHNPDDENETPPQVNFELKEVYTIDREESGNEEFNFISNFSFHKHIYLKDSRVVNTDLITLKQEEFELPKNLVNELKNAKSSIKFYIGNEN